MQKKYLAMLILTLLVLGAALSPVKALAENVDHDKAAGSDKTASIQIGKYGMLPIYGRDVSDGTYTIGVESGASVFSVSEAELIVEDGGMQARFTLSESYLYLYMGTGEEAAAADESAYIRFSEDEDGKYTYMIPVEALDKGLNCAAFHEDEMKWYDEVLLFDASTLPEDALLVELPDYDAIENAMNAWEQGTETGSSGESAGSEAVQKSEPMEPMDIDMEDGEYAVEVELAGGSGKASVSSPTILRVRDGKAYAVLTWSSSNYDYMIVGTEKYLNESEEGVNSSFEIPVACMDEGMPVIADTTAMGTPHEVSYTLTFYSESIGSKSQMPQEAAKRVVIIAVVIIVGGGILNHIINKKK